MGFLGLFKLTHFQPDRFEQELSALTQAISLNSEHTAALQRKQRVWRRHLILYGAMLYFSYVAVRYKASCTNTGPRGPGRSRLAAFVAALLARDLAAVALLPVFIAIVVYVVDAMFGVLLRSKNRSMQALLQKHKAKLDELKQVTNFSRTNQILEKFGSGGDQVARAPDAANAPEPALAATASGARNPAFAATVNEPRNPALPPTVNVPRKPRQSSDVESRAPGPRPAPARAEPAKLSLQDRLLDFIIGLDHNENVENRYALICANCYTHNGLAPPGCDNPVSVTYICRHCGYINGIKSETTPEARPEAGDTESPASTLTK
ncbi:hypothetical protein METBIDRAFT_76490 [Metschnikowia bicuspidata var. bicuspidata NRRL YB-4993]|uniref:Endoplasmic reticulum junction formation protein lunapark n=1 Tax=Metschnikowia bicuspidata var. bicuspidata NRRL YB-4993 TaxID=869754 RepID=A0A1A0HHJ3_9ASCO|nr:hypothetical protein METBIDRAFT_76490 [Metschnikowia bicuspidata var. bicuspidata NRRL YB-4993]OBA23476.1 hypothetical protein METBIDRAFT_76490 [Metschnikowia bicuspidata var. bicuspidata NRRL YB-4993]